MNVLNPPNGMSELPLALRCSKGNCPNDVESDYGGDDDGEDDVYWHPREVTDSRPYSNARQPFVP